MKKWFMALMALTLTLGLCACAPGGDGETQQLNQEPLAPVETTPSTEELMAASESDAEALTDDLPLVSDTDAALDSAAYETAQGYVGQPVEALYEAIGQPESAQYAASCLEEGAEDGMLFYGGFYLWTLRTETEELVHAVYLMD